MVEHYEHHEHREHYEHQQVVIVEQKQHVVQEVFEVQGTKDALTWAQMADGIPYRWMLVLVSWFLLIAAFALAVCLSAAPAPQPEGGCHDIFVALEPDKPPCHIQIGQRWTYEFWGIIQGVGWIVGFAILAMWLFLIGAGTPAIIAAIFKVCGGVFFTLLPANVTDPFGPESLIYDFIGICCFNVGNFMCLVLDCKCPPPGSDIRKNGFYYGNLTITANKIIFAGSFSIFINLSMLCWLDEKSGPFKFWAGYGFVNFIKKFGPGALLVGTIPYGLQCNAFPCWGSDKEA